jgi:hypothetical protein
MQEMLAGLRRTTHAQGYWFAKLKVIESISGGAKALATVTMSNAKTSRLTDTRMTGSYDFFDSGLGATTEWLNISAIVPSYLFAPTFAPLIRTPLWAA